MIEFVDGKSQNENLRNFSRKTQPDEPSKGSEEKLDFMSEVPEGNNQYHGISGSTSPNGDIGSYKNGDIEFVG